MIGKSFFNDLCDHFGIYPELVWNSSKEDNYYLDGKISIAKNPWQGRKMLIVHEFAHALDHSRNKYTINRGKSQHPKRYFEILVEVIQYAYGDPKKYPWECDYATLRKWAIEDGYAKKTRLHSCNTGRPKR